MGSSYWPYVWIVVLIGFSAFFSASEIAFSSANKLRLKRAAEEHGNKKEKLAYEITEDFDKGLSAILIGNNMANIAASSVATLIAMSFFGVQSTKGPAIATAVMTVLILIFGEITPKIVAKQNADKFATYVARPIALLMKIFGPINAVVVWIIDRLSALWDKPGEPQPPTVTEEELVSMIEIIENEGVIDEEQSELLQSALEFSDITAEEILTPRVDMEAVDADDGIEEIKQMVFDVAYSRIPVYEGTIDNIIGVLYLNHFFKRLVDEPDFSDIRSILMPPCFVHKNMTLPSVMNELNRRKTHIAIVIDEYGGTMGMLTMEDVLEELVGDIWDETDEIISDILQTSENQYLINGDLSIYDFLEHFDIEDSRFDNEYVTVGGWAIEMLDGYAKVGDSFTYKHLKLIIEEIDDLRVVKLTVIIEMPPLLNVMD